jgi:Tol biopolymer transport system component
MIPTVTLEQLMDRGVSFQPHEAVAIAQQLIDTCSTNPDLTPPLGPPSPHNVCLGVDGSVVCRGCAVTPAVSEIGILLEAMLPRGSATRAAGGLRYAIARSLLEVDAPPFDSLAQLSETLARYERGDRRVILRELYARGMTSRSASVMPFPDRRKATATSTELRRRLREADEERFALLAQPDEAIVPPILPEAGPRQQPTSDRDLLMFPPIHREPARGRAWLVGGAAAALVSFLAGQFLVSHVRLAQLHREAARSSLAAARPPAADESRVRTPSAAAVPTMAPTASGSTRPAARRAPGFSLVRASDRSGGQTFSPSFASNGTIFFHTSGASSERSDLVSPDPAGDLRLMTIGEDGARNYHVQPSPDGTKVAFDSDRDGERGVYVADRDGTGVRRVSGDGYAAVPSWSPDATRLAFVRGEADRPHVWNLWLLTLATGEMRRVSSFRYGQTWTGSWFPDGRRLAYSHEDHLFVVDLASGAAREYASPIARRLVRTPAVSPDGRHIVFEVSGSGAWLLDVSDGSMRCVLADPSVEEFAWSPDGRRVAFHSRRDGQWGIWFMTASSS